MKESQPYPLAKDHLYAAFLAEELKALKRDKKPATTIQAASTQAILERDPAKDEEHWNRPMPTNYLAVPDAKSRDELVAKKDFDAAQVAVVEDIRRKGRNTMGDAVSQGATSVSPEKKEKAIQAFQYSKPTEDKRMVLFTELTEITPPRPIKLIQRPKLNWFSPFELIYNIQSSIAYWVAERRDKR